jgi:hypothetical protein
MTDQTKYTKNSLVLIYAEIRYRSGIWLGRRIPKDWADAGGIREAILRWGYSSESRYNCLIEPLLGRVVKYQNREEKWATRGSEAMERGEKKKALAYFEKASYWGDKKDEVRKLRNPGYRSNRDIMNEVFDKFEDTHGKGKDST